MGRSIRRFFSVREGPRTAWDVIAWWEIRRPVYNLVLIACGFFSAAAILVLRPCFEPIMLMIGPPLFLIAANICYTAGWVVELIGRALGEEDSGGDGRLARWSMIAGLSFSILITAEPGLADIIGFIGAGRSYNPTWTFTEAEPRPADLAGTYVAIPSTRRFLENQRGYPDSAAFSLVLQSSGTAMYDGVPLDAFALWTPTLSSDTGRWELEAYSDGDGKEKRWGIRIEFPEQRVEADSTLLGRFRARSSTLDQFTLRNDEPPYELFQWAGEPGCEWVVYRQKIASEK